QLDQADCHLVTGHEPPTQSNYPAALGIAKSGPPRNAKTRIPVASWGRCRRLATRPVGGLSPFTGHRLRSKSVAAHKTTALNDVAAVKRHLAGQSTHGHRTRAAGTPTNEAFLHKKILRHKRPPFI